MSKSWLRVESPEGEAELRLSGTAWQLFVRRGEGEFKHVATGSLSGEDVDPLPEPFKDAVVGPLRLDADSWSVTLHGQQLNLTSAEFRVLAAMMQEPRRVFSREEIARVYATERSVSGVKSHLSRLRRKLGPEFIVNRRTVGWSLIS